MKRPPKRALSLDVRRCAIYTRKSTSAGLEQDFNSLDSQRESCLAYIERQPGWKVVDERYDDGGFTGANIERPAFQRLLADVEARKIDVVVVYKVDRLSRSLLDFAKDDLSFGLCLAEAAAAPELVAEFDRLCGTNLERRGSSLDLMVDDATGRTDAALERFIAFVWECIYEPLTAKEEGM